MCNIRFSELLERILNLSSILALFNLVFYQKKQPSYLLFFITGRCEASCGHCFFWQRKSQFEKELSLLEIESFAKSLGPMVQITITGGSPEMRNDLAEIGILLARFCRPLNMTLCSNGNQPKMLYQQVSKILEEIPKLSLTVDISLDALGKEHDRIRNVDGIFERVVESYQLLSILRKRYKNLRLGCGLCVSGLNEDTALKTASWAMDHLPLDNFTPILVRGNPRIEEARYSDPDVFLKIAKQVEYRLNNGVFSGYAAFPIIVNAKDIVQKEIIAKIYRTGSSPIRCSAGRETAVVYPDGSVPGCELRREVLGNLRDAEMNIREIWQGKEVKYFRQKIYNTNCTCWHQCFISPAIIKSPYLWKRIYGAIKRMRINTKDS